MKKEDEKILKHKDLTIETQNVWNIKKSHTSNNGGNWNHLKKWFRKYLSNIPGKREIKELQKTAMLVTAHELRFEKYAKVHNIQHGE